MLKTKKEIEEWLSKYKINNVIINDDLTVDVEGSVNMEGNIILKDEIKELPIQFGVVKGNFNISKRGLTTLKGCPYKVYGNFEVTNNDLNSLKNAPLIVTGNFNITQNNIASLEGCPEKIGKSFFADNNKLKTLEYGPKEVGDSYSVKYNHLNSLKHSPETIPYIFDCSNNELTSLEECPIEIGTLFAFRNQIQSLANFHSKINKRAELWGNDLGLKEFNNLNIEGDIVIDRFKILIPENSDVRSTTFVRMSYKELKTYIFQMELEEKLEIKPLKSLPKL